jgi:hypothetical protein
VTVTLSFMLHNRDHADADGDDDDDMQVALVKLLSVIHLISSTHYHMV